ncbi:MAG: GntR family transcriptional regulator [Coriobacteriaceae bacterium]|jgi:DNA-binding GntR family transcriptional regulator|nr:GntR family transcriptional regulator [Coriobacteriaceae bacterium]
MPGPVVSDVIENIHALILRGETGLGGRLPSERALADMLCVSRSSIREAIKEMKASGQLESRRGRRGGTFALADGPAWQDRGRMEVTRDSSLVIGRKVGRLWTLHNEAAQEGYELDTQVISACLEHCPSWLCEMFGLVGSRSLYRIVRKRSLADQPVSYEQTYFAPARFPDLLKQDLTQSLLLMAIDLYHEKATEIEEQVEVVAARGKTAQHLKANAKASLLKVEMRVIDTSGTTILYSQDHYRPDHVRLTIRNHVDA